MVRSGARPFWVIAKRDVAREFASVLVFIQVAAFLPPQKSLQQGVVLTRRAGGGYSIESESLLLSVPAAQHTLALRSQTGEGQKLGVGEAKD
jgi:hypothetical protein